MKLENLIAPRKAALAILVDPDKFNPALIDLCEKSKVAFFLVGGSRLKRPNLGEVIRAIKAKSKKPVIIFPGDETQVSKAADGLLLLSLLSGRNPDYLIGKHVKAARAIQRAKLPILPTAYLLIESGAISSTQKVTGTPAIPSNEISLIADTALAAEQLGFKAMYLEAGSGAMKAINSRIIRKVKATIGLPLIIGGGIDSRTKASSAIKAGANVVVVGNALEKNIYLLSEIEKAF